MSNMSAQGPVPYYFVPEPSRHPVMASLGLFFVVMGASQWINGADWGRYSLFFGLAMWLFVLYQWFGEAIHESETGRYGYKVDLSFRWSMSWFIFSEVMFFGAFSPPCGGRGCTRCRHWAMWKMRSCGPISKPFGPPCKPVPPLHRQAPSSPLAR